MTTHVDHDHQPKHQRCHLLSPCVIRRPLLQRQEFRTLVLLMQLIQKIRYNLERRLNLLRDTTVAIQREGLEA